MPFKSPNDRREYFRSWVKEHPGYMREASAAFAKRVGGSEPPRHGTVYAYGTYRCRCDLCRAANREYRRRYRLGRAVKK